MYLKMFFLKGHLLCDYCTNTGKKSYFFLSGFVFPKQNIVEKLRRSDDSIKIP